MRCGLIKAELTDANIRELKQRRRTRQRERQKATGVNLIKLLQV